MWIVLVSIRVTWLAHSIANRFWFQLYIFVHILYMYKSENILLLLIWISSVFFSLLCFMFAVVNTKLIVCNAFFFFAVTINKCDNKHKMQMFCQVFLYEKKGIRNHQRINYVFVYQRRNRTHILTFNLTCNNSYTLMHLRYVCVCLFHFKM